MDILFFAAIAVFILFKLRSHLGTISDEEKEMIAKKIKAEQERMAMLQKTIAAAYQPSQNAPIDNSNDEKIIANLEPTLKNNLKEILARANISAEFFINGVKSCFEMIIKAFAANDLTTLKFLLADKIYDGFEKSINSRKTENKTLNSNIISIDKVEILSAAIQGNSASVTVKIISKQINYFTNDKNEVIEGNKNDINQLTDVWTFKKDLTSPNPNWIVSTT